MRDGVDITEKGTERSGSWTDSTFPVVILLLRKKVPSSSGIATNDQSGTENFIVRVA